MKRLFLILILMVFLLPAGASECTKYLTDLYTKENETSCKIVSKQEFTDKYEQKIGDYYISSIVYGYGYMKKRKCRKIRIAYITLLDCNDNPIWGYVIPR